MKGYNITNKYGSGEIELSENLKKNIFIVSATCLTSHTEILSWANCNRDRIVREPFIADNIVIQGCCRNDMAVLKAMKILDYYRKEYVGGRVFLTGCLAKRMDIKLPKNVHRLVPLVRDSEYIKDRTLVRNEDIMPEWGKLFTAFYPLRIGSGNIRTTNACDGRSIKMGNKVLDCGDDAKRNLLNEIAYFDKTPALVCDRPRRSQLESWLKTSVYNSVPIAIYNAEIEELIDKDIERLLLAAARHRTLRALHCQFRSASAQVLFHFNVNVSKAYRVLDLIKKLRNHQVFCAADGVVHYKHIKDNTKLTLNHVFDYVRWEPYWNGKWNQSLAESRYKMYSNPTFDWVRR